MRYLLGLLVLLVLLLIAVPVLADDSGRVNVTADVVATTTALGAGASRITTHDKGSAETFGLDWYMTTSGSVNVEVQLRTSNAYAGPYDYPVSVRSTAFTTRTTITDGLNATDLLLCPARYLQVKLINYDASSVTLRRVTLYKY